MEGTVHTGSTNPYAMRRQKIFEALPENSAMLLPANVKIKRNADAEYPFRQDSNFYYVSGFIEDNALIVLLKTAKHSRFIVFCQDSHPLETRWQGPRLGLMGAKQILGADEAYPYSEIGSVLKKQLACDISVLYYSFTQALKINKMLKERFRAIPTHLEAGLILNELRLIKDAHEIHLMRTAAQISARAHVRAMQACRPGCFEYELEAEYLHEFMQKGARSPAYTSIVGAGANACILHYTDNQSLLKKGELVLADAGAEYQYYAADITRVFPVNGRFTEAQKIIYNLVLKAQLAAIEWARPHQPWEAMQAAIVKIFEEGLLELGIIQKASDYAKYYMHNSGHWLGLDVHDVGAYQVEGVSRLLKPGMVLTVEPGLYFPEDCLEIDEKWRGIGVRIEDDILVTEQAPEILSYEAPKTVQAIEQLMSAD